MRRRNRSHMSVVGYVLCSFGACIVTVGAVMAMTTASSFSRDRHQARTALAAAARSASASEADAVTQGESVLAGIAQQDAIASLDPAQCRSVFQGLDSVADEGSLYLLAPDHQIVCSLLARRHPVVDIPGGTWFADTQASGAQQYAGVRLDSTATPQIVVATPVTTASGTAVLVAALDTAVPPLDVGANSLPKMSLVEIDAGRSYVIATSAKAPAKAGALPATSWLRHPLPASRTARDADGVVRIYEQVPVKGLNRLMYAGVPRSVALHAATAERTHNLELAAAVLALVGYLGLVVHRRVARPIARLQAAIRDAGDDGTVQAPLAGPSEIAALADEFNATMAKRHDLEVDLAASVAKAEEASRMKSLFLANVSHEIRTPMNGVLGMLGLLRDEPLSAKQRDYLETMHDSADALLAIINDLLDFAKIEAGMVDIELISFPLRTCVRSAVSPWAPIALDKGVALDVVVHDGVPAFVTGDSTRVRQVLSNLVDNAVKFTPSGAVTVTVTAGEGDAVRFEVADTGIGLGDKRGEDLFEAFVQGDPSTTRRFGGTGLGLAICKQLVMLMGGDIDARARADHGGSVFWLELPLPAAAAPNHRVVAPDDSAPLLGGGTVLLAEDNVVNQKVARALIEQLGFSVDVAGNGREAVDLVAANRYVAVLMDLQMPMMDGFEATAVIRRQLGCTVPVYALSASVLPEDRVRCNDAGMNGHLAKPIDRAALRDALERAVTAAAQ